MAAATTAAMVQLVGPQMRFVLLVGWPGGQDAPLTRLGRRAERRLAPPSSQGKERLEEGTGEDVGGREMRADERRLR